VGRVLQERENTLLARLDRAVGIPVVVLAGAATRRRPRLSEMRRIGILNATAIGDTVPRSVAPEKWRAE
jgi:hypothetical protein